MSLRELFRRWTYEAFAPGALVRRKYESFRSLLARDRESLELLAELEELGLAAIPPADWAAVQDLCTRLSAAVEGMVMDLLRMTSRYPDLEEHRRKIAFYLDMASALPETPFGPPYVLPLDEVADRPGLAGGKAHHLAEVRTRAGLPAPSGFVVTASAFHYFQETGGLVERLTTELASVRLDDPDGLAAASDRLTELVLSAAIPAAVAREMEAALALLLREHGPDTLLAVRSSALAEDSEASFAGQYRTLLSVRPEDLAAAYKNVLAGKYSPDALTYRIRYGLSDPETPMAVLVIPLIPAVASGVIYSLDPSTPGPGDAAGSLLAVYSVSGSGEALVDGSRTPDVFYFDRRSGGPALVGQCSSEVCYPVMGGLPWEEDLSIGSEAAKVLADWAMRLEALYGRPQDVEWCQDRQGRLFVLQTRQYSLGQEQAPGPPDSKPAMPEDRLLYRGGVQASPGTAGGTVRHVLGEQDLALVPPECVVVTRGLSPSLARVIGRVRAVVAEAGSRASHFASVAREFGVPVLVGASGALERIPDGTEATVDAGGRSVYAGLVEGLDRNPARHLPRTPFHERLRQVLSLVSPLSLTDPDAEDFQPSGCRSMHDLIRFAHEKGVAEMFSLLSRGGRGLTGARELDSGLPLSMRVLDLGGGLGAQAREDGNVTPEDFLSPPMRALWDGLVHPTVTWSPDLLHFDWDAFSDVLAGGIATPGSADLSSYAVVDADYVHLMVRFGFHFAVVDSLVTDRGEESYANFRFKGGGADLAHRLRRVALIAWTLERAGFEVKTTADLLDASLQRREREQILRALRLLGFILARTRLLDMAMGREDEEERLVLEFTSIMESLGYEHG